MIDAIHVTAAESRQVQETLRSLLPADASVHAFGSRATGHGLKPSSDLDLLIDTPSGALPLRVMAELREAFAESDLPFRVDLLQRSDAAASFLSRIAASGMVPLLGAPRP
jgi:predicted nucleotidyltransferase